MVKNSQTIGTVTLAKEGFSFSENEPDARTKAARLPRVVGDAESTTDEGGRTRWFAYTDLGHLRRLKKKLDREQTLKKFRERRRFEKPSATRRRKQKAARFTAMLKARHAED